MKENILIIMMGSSRGGKYARKTQEKYLIKHLKADVAICFGDVDDIQDSFINTANYNWNFKDYDNWRTYFNNHYSENLINNLEKGRRGFQKLLIYLEKTDQALTYLYLIIQG